jgi:hypothetical protein
MSAASEPPPDETPKPGAPPPGIPGNPAMAAAGAFVARLHEEHLRKHHLIAALTALNIRSHGWFLAPGPLPEDHPFYALVGRVASEWAHLEHIVDLTIWELLLARGLTREHVKPFRKLRSEAFDDADWRARWVHDPWFIQEGTQPAQFRAMPDVDPRFGLQAISEDEVKSTIDEIKKLQQQARDAQKIVLDALAALREKPA